MRTKARLLALAFLLLAATGCPGHKKLALPGIFEACGPLELVATDGRLVEVNRVKFLGVYTLCNGKGINHPPPTTTISWYDPRSYWDTGPMKRRSFLLSLLAPALAFLGIGRDRIPGATSMVIDGPGGKLVFPNVVIRRTFPAQVADGAEIEFVMETRIEPYGTRWVAPRTTEGDPFS